MSAYSATSTCLPIAITGGLDRAYILAGLTLNAAFFVGTAAGR